MALLAGWHGCRFDILSVHPSGMIGHAYIYARKGNKITQVAKWQPGEGVCGRYQVDDLDNGTVGGEYTAETLKEVMRIAGEREAARLLELGAKLAGRAARKGQ